MATIKYTFPTQATTPSWLFPVQDVNSNRTPLYHDALGVKYLAVVNPVIDPIFTINSASPNAIFKSQNQWGQTPLILSI